MSLKEKSCEPCKGGVPPLNEAEASALLIDTPGWSLIDNNKKIECTYKFSDFASALNLAVKAADIAEEEGHHPDITFGWGYCKILFYTHKINGLHENDFIMAAKINMLANS